jgi:hypothetical protein
MQDDPLKGCQALLELTDLEQVHGGDGGRDEDAQPRRSGTILVNRDLTDWIAPAMRSDVRPPELVPELQGRGLAKDFTPLMQGREA